MNSSNCDTLSDLTSGYWWSQQKAEWNIMRNNKNKSNKSNNDYIRHIIDKCELFFIIMP